MKTTLILFCLPIMMFFKTHTWHNDLSKAQITAKNEHKLILLNFSGSDWCAPCIMLKKQVFQSDDFQDLAEEKLVLLRADFPRMKKNRLPAEEMKKNEFLAEKYNPEGKFPYTLLLNEDGEVIKSWDGYKGNPEEMLAEIKASTHE